MIVGVSFVKGQAVEEKIPHVTVATNEFRKYGDIERFVKNAC